MVSKIYAREVDETSGIVVELSGEFDIGELDPLSKTLDQISRSGLPAFVDLSRVTFLDASCTRELASRSELCGGCLSLRSLSWQARASFRICGYSSYGDRVPARSVMESSHSVLAAAS